MRIASTALLLVTVGLGFAWHGGLPAETATRPFEVIAHRGAHTPWDSSKYDRRSGCEAVHLVEPLHPAIENTLESIASAFRAGATMVEVDVRLTKDRQFAVFHDFDLSCRTDGKGRVGERTLHELKRLDIGFGYTMQGTGAVPFRGKGVGKLPSLDEVLAHFAEGKLLIDHKDQSPISAEILGAALAERPSSAGPTLFYWGPRSTFASVSARTPAMTRLLLDRTEVKACLLPYLLTLGMTGLGELCRQQGIGIPYSYAKFLWGWPHRFLRRAHSSGARVYVLTDSPADARELAALPIDGIITDNILEVGPAIRDARRSLQPD